MKTNNRSRYFGRLCCNGGKAAKYATRAASRSRARVRHIADASY